MSEENAKKVRRSYDLPENLVNYFKNWKPGKDLSPKVAGAILYFMTLNGDFREKCERLAYSEDIGKAMRQLRVYRIPVLPIRPEEKAVLMPAGDFERLFVAMVKAKPTLLGKLIAESLAVADDNEFASIVSSLKHRRKGRKSAK